MGVSVCVVHWKEHKLSLVGFTCLGACVQLDSLELRSKSSTTGSLSGRLRRVASVLLGWGRGRRRLCAAMLRGEAGNMRSRFWGGFTFGGV